MFSGWGFSKSTQLIVVGGGGGQRDTCTIANVHMPN